MLVKTPPMGWNSWNTFGVNINEQLIRDTADAIVASGLKDAGYEYVVIDDCWSVRDEKDDKGNIIKSGRDAEGRLVADPEKFPSGMKALADYIHSKGLKFGMYSCDGPLTCAGYPASYQYEFIDAKTFAEWGVDYLKYDNCYKPNVPGRNLYNRMSMALKASGRDIVFSACNWGAEDVQTWIRSTGAHLYRSTGDINDSFGSFRDLTNSQLKLWPYSATGCYNDIDMLICGMYGKGNVAVSGCTDLEYRTHFAIWSVLGTALMIGCDVRNMNDATLDLLKNKDLIEFNQDEDARPPYIIHNEDNKISFLRHLANGEYVIMHINFSDVDAIVPCNLDVTGITKDTGYCFDVRDIFTGEKQSGVIECFCQKVAAHDCKVFRAKLVEAK